MPVTLISTIFKYAVIMFNLFISSAALIGHPHLLSFCKVLHPQ